MLQKCSEINVDENDLLVTTDMNSLNKKNDEICMWSSSFKQLSVPRLQAPICV